MRVKCRDCGKTLDEADLQSFRANSFEVQDGDEGICQKCLVERREEGDDPDDLIAEFCG